MNNEQLITNLTSNSIDNIWHLENEITTLSLQL